MARRPFPGSDLPAEAAVPQPASADGGRLAAGMPSPLARAVLAIGSIGLLAAMATDALSVAGRHTGVRLFGAIEIVQACIVLIATAAVVLTTLIDGHARVHILLERASVSVGARLLRLADAISALVFCWLAIGSIWLSVDLWAAFELSEVLNLPLRWLRVAWIMGLLATAGLFARRAVAKERR